jgi:ABC-type methionine transport system ATPase subunit
MIQMKEVSKVVRHRAGAQQLLDRHQKRRSGGGVCPSGPAKSTLIKTINALTISRKARFCRWSGGA